MALWRLDGIALPMGSGEEVLRAEIASRLALPVGTIGMLRVVRRSLDARRRRPPRFVYSVEVSLPDELDLSRKIDTGITIRRSAAERKPSPVISAARHPKVIIVGAGPAGLFAALTLAEMGISPRLLERGKAVAERLIDVETFWREGKLDRESHVHFGEGGAGTFSDGKLTSRAKNPRTEWIKKTLVDMGAPSQILTDAKPHIGTDRLRSVVINLREHLRSLGCEVRFGAKATDFLIRRERIEGVVINDREEIRTNHLLLAAGHSAADTYEQLHARGVRMAAKAFAIGLRVEHPQELINGIQYGRWAGRPDLPPADYFLAVRVAGGDRSVYTFCMCPGGRIIGCSSQEGEVVTNGMSYHRRDSPFANSAVVVTVGVTDLSGESSDSGALRGLTFRRRWEERAFIAGGGNYHAPAQQLTDFLAGRESRSLGPTSFLPGVSAVQLAHVLPPFVAEALKEGFRKFENKMAGFITAEAMLVGVETRTSSPVRILRGTDGQSISTAGIYPCGEGAGYAGGIISSALDGIRAAGFIGCG